MKIYQIFLLFLLVFIAISCSKTYQHDCLISNVNIIDVKTGQVLPNRSVAIDSNTISAIYSEPVILEDILTIIDGSDKYLIPGLWDMHAHYIYDSIHEICDPLLLANGITGIREMWGNMDLINSIRKQASTARMHSPEIYSAGAIIDGDPPMWQGSTTVKNSEEARGAAIDQINEGVDFIKIYSFLNDECFWAISETANENGIPFAGHVPYSVTIYDAINAGMSSAEHFYGIMEACSPKIDSINKLHIYRQHKPLYETFDDFLFDSLCLVLAESKMWICPTLVASKAFSFQNDTSFTNDHRLTYFPADKISFWEEIPQVDYQFYRIYSAKMVELVGKMHDKGVKILAGTDFPNPYLYPGFSLHDELSLFVDGGMSEIDALKTATINPARFMGKDKKFGSVDVDKIANLVLLDGNPIVDIGNTKSIEIVVLRGQVFDRNDLDTMLEKTRTNTH